MTTARISPRSRTIRMMLLAWSFILAGVDVGIVGPTLPDLQSTVHKPFRTMNYLFLSQGIGFLLGIILVGLLSRYNMYPTVAASVLVGSVVNAAIPNVTVFGWMVVLFLIQGVTLGVIDIACMDICICLYSRQTWQLIFINTVGSASSFVMPLLVEPFLSKTGSYIPLKTNATPYCPGAEMYANCTSAEIPRNMSSCAVACSVRESTIAYPYLIMCCITLPNTFGLLYYYFKDIRQEGGYVRIPDKDDAKREYSPLLRRFMLVMMFLFHLPTLGIVMVYTDILTTLGTTTLDLSKEYMALMTSAYLFSLLIGRVVNSILSKFINLFYLLSFNLVVMLGFALLSVVKVSEDVYVTILWVTICGFGYFVSSLVPLVLTWAVQIMPLGNLMLNLSLFACGVGHTIMPYMAGMVLDSFGMTGFMYFVVATSVYEIFTFSIIALILLKLVKPKC